MANFKPILAATYFALFCLMTILGSAQTLAILAGLALGSLVLDLISDAVGMTSYNYTKG